MIESLIQHLEHHLGQIVEGWKSEGTIQVVRFQDQPTRGVTTYSTVGLSDAALPMPRGRSVRQELIASVYSSYDRRAVASFLMSFAEYVIDQGRALLRGDVIGPGDPLVPGVRATAVYASIPVFLGEGFSTYQGTSPPTVLVWLLPLPSEDAHFVTANGWEPFEDRLEATAVDFWSLDRAEASA